MLAILAGSAVLSLFHALIPSHWLPILAVGRREGWPPAYILWVTFIAAMAHVASTVLVGLVLAWMGGIMAEEAATFTHWIAPAILMVLGAYYIYQHYYHHHFHLHKQPAGWGLIASLAAAMFLSPCFEIEGYFLAAGPYGWHFVFILALTYGVMSVLGMLAWVYLALHGLRRLNWHAWEHNAGLVAGVALLVSGGVLLCWH
jgi:nickel/cobalt transporter (NicO) family protein